MEIIEQLKRVVQRLDMVEDHVVATSQQAVQGLTSGSATGRLSTDTVTF